MENSIYSEIKTVTLVKFKTARYVVISSSPEEVALSYMDNWAKKSGLLDLATYEKKRIGWDFPFLTEEQQQNFNLRGYVAAYVIPEDFVPKCDGAEIVYVNSDTYATITITNPHIKPWEYIPTAYDKLMNFTHTISWKGIFEQNRQAFEEEYDVDGVHYMDIYVPIN